MTIRRFSTWLALGLSLLLCALVLVVPARAQSKEVEVERRDARITIQTNGDVRMVETWQVNFIGGPFHFAYREIPINHVNGITDWQVSEGGQPYSESSSQEAHTYTLEQSGDNAKITWYFPETTEDHRTFELGYTLQGAVLIYPEGDQFFWKFVESDRQYTIKNSTVVVTLPASFQTTELKNTTYVNGTEQQGGARVVDGQTVEFTGGPFAPSTEWEFARSFRTAS